MKLTFEFLLIAALALAIASLATPWWSFVQTTAGGTLSESFLPGSTFSVTCAGSGCGGSVPGQSGYGSIFGNGIAALYGVALGLVIGAAALTAILALLYARNGFRGRTFRIPRPRLFLGLSLLASALALVAAVVVAAAQPGAFASSTTFPGTAHGGLSPLDSFWGAADGGGALTSWGAGVGWFFALASGGIVLATSLFMFVLAWRTGVLRAPASAATATAPVLPKPLPMPMTLPRVAVTTAGPVPVIARTYTAPPSASAVPAPMPAPSGPPAGGGATVDCPACGFTNSARSKTCSYCQRPLKA